MSFIVPVTFTRKTRSQTASDTSPTGVMSSMIPAMLARPSIVPPAASMIRATPASSVMSAVSVDDVASGMRSGELIQALLAHVDCDDATAFAGDAGCRGAADSRTCAGHDHGLTGEPALIDPLGPLAQRGRRSGCRRVVRTSGRGIRSRGHVAGGGTTDQVIEHLLREGAAAHLHQAFDRQPFDRLEDVGALPALRQHAAQDGTSHRVVEPGGDGGVAGQRRGCSGHDVFPFRPDNSVRY